MATAGLIGPILGPILGGWLVVHTSWHWIFFINIPIGMLGFWAAAKVMGNHKGNANKLDWTGFLLFAFGLAGLTLGLDLLGESHRDNMTTYSALSIGIALLVAYYFYAKVMNVPFCLYLFQYKNISIRHCSQYLYPSFRFGCAVLIAINVPTFFLAIQLKSQVGCLHPLR